jgi:hypothetical protein
LILDLKSIKDRLRERDEAIRQGNLGEAELRRLQEEGMELTRQLRAIRASLTPELCQAEALLRQLDASRARPTPNLDVHL